ncbi:bifunctional phosphopantothenoylcysteine decarboxylase/phosphopantothenate--cysteine ligase CoaBC [Nocardiopsis changdeensis]|uniref:Coenzyme A biosynthesis bifunctional protein CoaBC n=1 Tax=Nocardiopsis changdeensis TaxID=2831969 RepID=A0ABX8BR13_9ACTN|nr:MULTISPECIES: bifunctional phosphopantothenoylcysteine decarboxylase/phosphopantothenate--cysteine ligase CoaBC [Nocardiopsis]QUX24519.1 bifunctional phosphopantothenoylcysteine decarboxylase/phosphopantothenate--cysteine ligase CoaBC [Nocardiopsis changdeensis]QYX34910.1 bifunctional phosphopantothenoylcysteine decarboxylase/phosphopantothenate--cysteine ligase CoaBC [Nocardiopsis sp. MT53]
MSDTGSKPQVVLGVGGGIAAYKVCELLRRLTESGHEVRVVPTDEALRFVGEPTWAALSGNPVATGVWDAVHEVPHVRIGQSADLVLVAPATANILAKAAAGLADDLLTNTLLTARCPVVFAPAMHTEMWEHPATQANVATLRSRGAVVLDPAVGRLTGADTGRGRLPEPAELFEAARRVLSRGAAAPDLAGVRVVISAGGTREAIDPVRFIGNHSSGKQGYALARTAAARGADVTLVAANVALPDPAGVRVVPVTSAVELAEAVGAERAGADVIVMSAAVADFRPAASVASKIKKSGAAPAPIELVENPDVLAGLVVSRDREGTAQVIVGFAAETDDVIANGRAKLARKGCDLLVVNQVGGGRAFGTEDNQAVVLGADGSAVEIPRGPKEDLADRVWDLVGERLPR